jgi:homoserine/homoserine lactone efflux protein
MTPVVASMTLHAWMTFVLVAIGVSLIPGPAVVAVVSSALRGGFRASLATNAGVLVGDAAFVAATALGLGALLVASHPLFQAVKWLGVAYLAYLGGRALFARGAAYAFDAPGAGTRAFRLGLTTQLANPQIVLFFGALLPQFVDPARPVALQFAILGATFIVGDALVFAAYGALAHHARAWLRSPRAVRVTSRVSGAAMLGVAARLAAEH